MPQRTNNDGPSGEALSLGPPARDGSSTTSPNEGSLKNRLHPRNDDPRDSVKPRYGIQIVGTVFLDEDRGALTDHDLVEDLLGRRPLALTLDETVDAGESRLPSDLHVVCAHEEQVGVDTFVAPDIDVQMDLAMAAFA